VILDFEYDNNNGLLFVIIENIGASSAYRVSVKFNKEITGIHGERKITEMNIFKYLEFLPPRKKIRIFVDIFSSYLIREQPLLITTTILYSNKNNQKFQDVIEHNLSIYKDMIDIKD
ncbi:MAG: hypothetical protein ACJ719_03325, partial [Nitrososphaeraceae archaeon]